MYTDIQPERIRVIKPPKKIPATSDKLTTPVNHHASRRELNLKGFYSTVVERIEDEG